jgi:hypothetical protein
MKSAADYANKNGDHEKEYFIGVTSGANIVVAE